MPAAGKMSELVPPDEQRYWLRNVILITIAQFFAQVAFCSAMTFMPFWFKDIAHISDKGDLSIYVALYAAAGNLSFCVCSPVWGALGDRFGRRLMLLRATVGGAILTPLMAFISSPALMIWHRLALGGLVGTVTAAQSLIVTTTPQKHMTIALGMASAGMFGGIMAGQFAGGEMVRHFGFFTTFIWSGILLGVSTVLILFTKENFKPVIRKVRHRRRRLAMPRFGRAGILLLLFIVMGFARDIDGPFLPQLVMKAVEDSKEALRWTGWINGLCALGGIFSGLILGYAASKVSVLKVLCFVIGIAGVMRLLLAFAPSAEIIMVERFIQVLAAGGMEPMFQAWLAGVTLAHHRSQMLGWSATARSAGWIFGSLIGGVVAKFLGGVSGLFLISGLLYLAMIPMVSRAGKKVPPPPVQK